jgi:hypothetical protein
MNYCAGIEGSGTPAFIGFFIAGVQRAHSSNTYLYKTAYNEQAEKILGDPSYYQIERLKKYYSGR